MLTISELSNSTALSTRIIRHYTTIGLLSEHLIANKTSSRCYDNNATKTLEVIIALRELGFNLNEIGTLLNKKLKSTIDFKVKIMHNSRADLKKKLHNQKKSINTIIQFLKHYDHLH